MKIKSKLVIILVLIGLILGIHTSVILWNFIKNTEQIKISEATFEHLLAATKIRSAIHQQMKEVFVYLNHNQARHKEKFEELKIQIDRELDHWGRTALLLIDLGKIKEQDHLEIARVIKIKYLKRLEVVEKIFDLVKKGENNRAFLIARKNFTGDNSKLFHEKTEESIKNETKKLDDSYQDLLVRSGLIPWVADKSGQQIKIAKVYLRHFLIINKLHSSLAQQIKNLNLNTNDEQVKKYFETQTIETKINLREWGWTIRDLTELGVIEEESSQKALRKFSGKYEQLLFSARKQFALPPGENSLNNIKFEDGQTDSLIGDVLLLEIEEEIEKSTKAISKVHQKLLDFTYSSGIQSVIFLAIISLSIVLLSLNLIKGMLASLDVLNQGIEIMGTGNLNHQIELSSKDELGLLANSFNKMTQKLRTTLVDNTDLKMAEKELKKYRFHLEELVEERTAKLKNLNEQLQQEISDRKHAEMQLRQSQKLEALGTLAGGISHDFNNLLFAMLCYITVARDSLPKKSELRDDLEQALNAGERAKELIRQILSFSRQSEQPFQPVQVAPILRETVKLLRATLPVTTEIKCNILSDCGNIHADPSQIHQVIMNLCTNAGFALRDKGGLLDISMEEISISSDFASPHGVISGIYLKLTIRDTGIGIKADDLERIFDPFFTTKPVGEGTGMGLSVVHGIIKNHSGMITVSSTLGEGTKFNVYFPKMIEVIEPTTQEKAIVSSGEERILLVDDEQVVLNGLKRLLEKLGYQVTATTDSLEALRIFNANPFQYNLMITDQSMTGLNGYQLAREILSTRPEFPIILITGFSESISPEKAKKIGISEFLLKPFLSNDLSSAIQRVLRPDKVTSINDI